MAENRVALVTGSSRGIGRAIAQRLAQDGMKVILTGRDEAALTTIERDIRDAGGEATFLAIDLRDPAAPAKLIAIPLEQYGQLDVLVNNAGATKRGAFLALSDEDWMDGYALKLHGAVRLTRAAWPHLAATRGSIINIAGSGGRTPGPEFAVGGSVNAALMAFTKSIADTALPDGIQVNCINPGPVRTGRLTRRLATLSEAEFIAQEKISQIGEPEDIAALVAFLLTPSGRYLHGSLIDADGGATKSL